jgi:hypothetical protein
MLCVHYFVLYKRFFVLCLTDKPIFFVVQQSLAYAFGSQVSVRIVYLKWRLRTQLTFLIGSSGSGAHSIVLITMNSAVLYTDWLGGKVSADV